MSSPGNQNSTDSKHEIVIKDNITTVKILETCVDEPPTEIQKEKLLQFEEEFISRYTDDDEDYVAAVKLGIAPPPLVSSYYGSSRHQRSDNKRKWEDRGNRHSHDPHHKRPNHGYNNDNRR